MSLLLSVNQLSGLAILMLFNSKLKLEILRNKDYIKWVSVRDIETRKNGSCCWAF